MHEHIHSAPPISTPSPQRPRALLLAMCGCVALVFGLALGIIAIVPAMATDLGASQTAAQWIADVFPLTVAALLLPAGALLDRLGHRRGVMCGLGLLTVALGLTALARTSAAVIGARALSGAAMALVFPGTLPSLSSSVRGRGRTFAVAVWAIAGIAGGVVGMMLCAYLADTVSWRAAFTVFACLSAGLLVLVARAVPPGPRTRKLHTDPFGSLLSVGGVGLLVSGITEVPVHGWNAALTLPGMIGGVVMLAGFAVWESRHPTPLLEVRIFADRRFAGASLAIFGMVIADFAMIFLVFQYEAYVLDFSPMRAALGIAPPSIVMLIVVPLALLCSRRLSERTIVTTALCACAAGASISAFWAGARPSYIAMTSGTVLIWAGIGFGIISPTLTILDGLPAEQQGLASALNDLTRELGAAFGIAITGSAFNGAYRSYLSAHRAGNEVTAAPGAALHRAAAPDFDRLVRAAVMHGWHSAFIAAGTALTVCAVAAFVLYPRAKNA